MSYTIYNTDGSILLTLGDGKIDKVTTSLTLIGRNVSSYGEYYNNNLVKLLENFANTDQPTSPVVGQLWYDTAAGRLKVYDLNSLFRPVSNAIVSDAVPVELAPTDFWFDSINEQLYFTIDGQELTLVGPQSSAVYGQTGLVTDSIADTYGTYRSVTKLYSSGQLVGIISTASFTLPVNTSGFTTVDIGLNLNPSIQGIKFIGTATSADSISGFNIENLMRKGVNETTTGSITIVNDGGLVVNNSIFDGISIYADPLTHVGIISNDTTDQPFNLKVTNLSSGLTTAQAIDSANLNMGIWTDTPTYPLDIVGDTRIQGNLYVQGTTTNITSVNLQVYDNNIELGYGQGIPDDTFADYGGITLHGTTDHTIAWRSNGTGWNFNDHVSLTGISDSYQINGVKVLSKTKLENAVVDAPGLTSIGTLAHLTVTNVYISGSTIQPIGTSTLKLSAPDSVSLENTRIANLHTPVYDQDGATKKYVDDAVYLVGTKAYGISLDATNFSYNFGTIDLGVKYYLDLLFPIFNAGGATLIGNISGTTLTVESLITGSLEVGLHVQGTGVTPNTFIVSTGSSITEWIVNVSQSVPSGSVMEASGDNELDIPDGVRAKVLVGTTVIPTTTATVNVNFATDQVDKGGWFFTATVVSGLTGSIASELPAQTYIPVTTYTVQTWRVLTGVWTRIL